MAARQWTKAQSDAINARGGSIIVSAAAGSGKTAVLVERIITLLSDPENPVDADRLLVATFSTAAADEIKERITKRITQAVYDEGGNKRLQRQLNLLPCAKIGTIHSICLGILRENSELLDIDSAFRVADRAEILALEGQAIDLVMQNGYESGDEDFLRLVKIYSEKNDDSLGEIIKDIYDFIRSFPFPKDWLDFALGVFENRDIDSSNWKGLITGYVSDMLSYNADCMKQLCCELEQFPELDEKYGDVFRRDEDKIRYLAEFIKTAHWDDAVNAASTIAFDRLPPIKNLNAEEKEFFKKQRSDINKKVKSLLEYFNFPKEYFAEDAKYLYPVMKRLFEAVKEFYDIMDEMKAQKGIVEFSDLELYTIKLLCEKKDGKYVKSEAAKRISEQFDQIFIDEFQDTNDAQNLIIDLLSKDGSNIFVVGDVKQSIYGFRKAMPENFIRRKDEAKPYDSGLFPARIELNANFRSREDVTGFVNFLFFMIMSRSLGDVEYDEKEALVPKGVFPEAENTHTELHITDLSGMDKKDMVYGEPYYVAGLIRDMIEGGYMVTGEDGKLRQCSEGDFCILLRAKKSAERYAKALKEYGIAAMADNSVDFFSSSEISSLISLLKIIDNPLDDISFLSAAMSPAFGFTPDEMAQARTCEPEASFYSAFVKYAQQNKKAANFLGILERLREKSVLCGARELVREIYDSTDVFAVAGAMSMGDRRRENLRRFIDCAINYEKTRQTSLSGFIRFLERSASNDSLEGGAVENVNAVRIISIHRSKGLEFPVCILAECAKNFNLTDTNGNILKQKEYGISSKVIRPQKLMRYSTSFHDALKIAILKDNLSEEMRILYVALTRAKEKLILSCAFKNPDEIEKIKNYNLDNGRLSRGMLMSAKRYSDWILPAALYHPDGEALRERLGVFLKPVKAEGRLSVKFAKVEKIERNSSQEITERTAKPDLKIVERLKKQAEYVYPYAAAANASAKLSITQLSKGTDKATPGFTMRPDFMAASGMTGAERGTAAHKFMQFADFEKARSNLEEEIKRLVEGEFIAGYEADSLNRKKLLAFFSSPLVERILNADKVYKEYSFFDEIPALEIYPDEPALEGESILVQGIADCVITEGERVAIIDYKTDKVKDESELILMYKPQLDLYERAVRKAFDTDKTEKIIYSMYLEKEITIR